MSGLFDLEIVQTLFAISRLDAGEAQQEWSRFDLAPVAASTTEQMSLLAEDKGISVACNVQGKVNVDGDRARIKQVVVNQKLGLLAETMATSRTRRAVRNR